MTGTVLIVDDDPVQRRLVEAILAKSGYRVLQAEGGEAALDVLAGEAGADINVLILDLVMPGMDGIAVLTRMRERGIDLPVVVQTARGGIDTAVEAMRNGAFDFLVKPASPEKLLTAVGRASRLGAFEKSVGQKVPRVNRGGFSFNDIVTRSPAMERVLRLGRKAAASDIPILIEGESGVGKELVARAIRGASTRKGKPFVTVNCGAIPENLVESILFGHEKGAFTGATERHVGKFVEADGGTLFLDEIGDLPLDMQVKLLRAVQEGEVEPVGARAPLKVDIRLISATHRDLLQRVRDGLFREDLFYRLNVFPIFVPPLRNRTEDIPYLVDHFIRAANTSGTGGKVSGIAPEALTLLMAYDWPGNIRQLENAVFRALVLSEDSLLTCDEFPQIRAQIKGIDLQSLQEPGRDDTSAASAQNPAFSARQPKLVEPEARNQPEQKSFGIVRALDERGNVRSLADVELEMIRLAIDRYQGQMSEVARRLGIGRSTLYRKLKEYGIDAQDGQEERFAV